MVWLCKTKNGEKVKLGYKNTDSFIYIKADDIYKYIGEDTSNYWGNIDNDYRQNLRVLYTFVSNKSFGQLLDISSKIFIF